MCVPSSQTQQKLSEATMMARNRNHLANKTMHALQFITASYPKPFVAPTMVGRIAAMLNYTLQQLVGPRQRELKVRTCCQVLGRYRDIFVSAEQYCMIL